MSQKELSVPNIQETDSYKEDGRRSLTELFEGYNSLFKDGWIKVIIAEQSVVLANGSRFLLPVYSYRTPMSGTTPVESMWILGGVHGEEPAGPNAFFEKIAVINELRHSGISAVFIPLMNPAGYFRDWRYEDERRDYTKGHSVSDSEHLLLASNSEGPRVEKPASESAAKIISWVEKTSTLYLPKLAIDHHEDRVPEKFPDGDPRNLTSCYVYASGNGSHTLEIAQKINHIFKESGLPVVDSGTTRFGEAILQGVVDNASDGSIDEFLTADKYYSPPEGKIKNKYPAPTSIVVETTIPFDGSIPLSQRVLAHGKIIDSYVEYWKLVDEV